MRNLILLHASNVHLSNNFNCLPSALKVLIWERYSLKALPRNIDQLYQVVELRLRRSKIKFLWNGSPFLGKLKFIDLSHSEDLTEMPDLKGIQNLESLLLEGCISLVRVHESLGQHKKLLKLNLKDCKNLVILPNKLEMNSLEELIFCGCLKLEKLPEFGENMKSLCICDVSETNVKEVPSSIIHLTNLRELSLRGSISRLSSFLGPPIPTGLRLPISLSGLSSLKKLDLSFCGLCDGSIPDDLSGLSSLMNLNLRGNNFAILPAGCVFNLSNLEYIYLSDCPRLQSMPQLPPNLIKVDASHCPSMEPLSSAENLIGSLVSKHRSLLLYEQIVLHISGDEIPTWFEQREYFGNGYHSAISITVNIPYVRDRREWSGIAVCLLLNGWGSARIEWSFKAAEDDIPYSFRPRYPVRFSCRGPQLYIAFFPFNSFNCWRHLSGDQRRNLQLLITTPGVKIMGYGWRLICKEDFEVYDASNGSSGLHITELDNVNN